MKIAFVGKGGSGKSTVSSLFINHLLQTGNSVLAVDADINQHLASLIGAPFDSSKAVSGDAAAADIRAQLIGTNSRIKNGQSFIKTTPPGRGSKLIRIEQDDPIISRHTVGFAPHGYFMHVGTYEDDEIGTSCYHTNLSIFENIVSHTVTDTSHWLVADMVAGTDAFAGALHLLFDAVFMVVEPTPESVAVYKQYAALAKQAGTEDQLFVIANKLIDDDDEVYVREAVGDAYCAGIAFEPALRKSRQQGKTPELLEHTSEQLTRVVTQTHQSASSGQLQRLHELHRRHAGEDYIVARHGDLTGQIDPDFVFTENDTYA